MGGGTKNNARRGFLSRWARTVRRGRREMVDFWNFICLGVVEVFHALLEALYTRTLPITQRLFSRVPKPPIVTVQDIRAGRIRLDIKSSFASLFNVEEFQVEWATAGTEEWKSLGAPNDLAQRTVARLASHTPYQFRVRAHNSKGVSGWSEVVAATTRIDPKAGGGYGPGYTWTQTSTEVTATFELPPGTTKRDILLVLKGESLLVELRQPPPLLSNLVTAGPGSPQQGAAARVAAASNGSSSGCTSPRAPPRHVLLEGILYGKVRSFENGSFWELIREDGKQLLILTFEKQAKSLAPKFDYWRSLVHGHDEIDTHKIVSEPQEGGMGGGMQMLQPGMMDPAQLQQFGLA